MDLVILPGHDKMGRAETFQRMTLRPGDSLAVVGPTGSGKSRLLADIEWMADGDIPTGRHILVDGKRAVSSDRHVPSKKLVAQLSQTGAAPLQQREAA
jgi:ABC-type lipoprotein export system ATPase subunit